MSSPFWKLDPAFIHEDRVHTVTTPAPKLTPGSATTAPSAHKHYSTPAAQTQSSQKSDLVKKSDLPFHLTWGNHTQLENYIVRLTFRKDAPLSGNGFLIQLPDTSYDIVLTAGHNLIDDTGKPVSGLTAYEHSSDSSTGRRPIKINPEDVEICREFKANPKAAPAKHDYGIIKLERDPKRGPRPGFGVDITLGENKDLEDEELECHVNITGYRTTGAPFTNTGKCKIRSDYLEYWVTTEMGISGSPVWTGYSGSFTAIAVHTDGAPPGSAAGSKGTRINLAVYREICRWAGTGDLKKRLRAVHKSAPAGGTFLSKCNTPDIVQKGVGTGNALVMDILPVVAPPVTARRQALYAFYAVGENKWISWNTRNPQNATLVETLAEPCLVRVVKRAAKKTLRIVMERDGNPDLIEAVLKVSDTDEVVFQKHKSGKRTHNAINDFCLE